MANEFTALVRQEGDYWIGWIAEIPGVNCQEETHLQLMETLAVSLNEALEFNREEARKLAGSYFSLENIFI